MIALNCYGCRGIGKKQTFNLQLNKQSINFFTANRRKINRVINNFAYKRY